MCLRLLFLLCPSQSIFFSPHHWPYIRAGWVSCMFLPGKRELMGIFMAPLDPPSPAPAVMFVHDSHAFVVSLFFCFFFRVSPCRQQTANRPRSAKAHQEDTLPCREELRPKGGAAMTKNLSHHTLMYAFLYLCASL